VCFCISAFAGDLIGISGRRVGSLAGRLVGGEWGAVLARTVLGIGVVGGGMGFALLCSVSGHRWLGTQTYEQDHILPINSINNPADHGRNLVNIICRTTIYSAHIWLGERIWTLLLSGSTSGIVQHPEKSVRPLRRILSS
jgi:hypothetical protein